MVLGWDTLVVTKNLYLSQLLDDRVDVDCFLLAPALIPSPEVEGVPGDRRDVQDISGSRMIMG